MSFALPDALFFTGIDWAAETHAVCVTDAGGKIAAGFTIEHSADGIALLVRRLARYGEAGVMPVAIERPDGRLVDLLLEAGHPVVPVSPNAIKTWRDGEVLSGARSDAGDAAVIAEYLRLRAHRLKTAAPYSDETLALRTAVRTRGDLVEMRVAASTFPYLYNKSGRDAVLHRRYNRRAACPRQRRTDDGCARAVQRLPA